MIKKVLCTILTLITLSTIGYAQTCYDVTGNVNTINISDTDQMGTIALILIDKKGNEAFNDSGPLFGHITGASNQATFLSHTATSSANNDIFHTIGDVAKIKEILKTNADGEACAFSVQERISTIDYGSGFFGQVKSVDIKAKGYINVCLPENENAFELSGEICLN